LPAVDQDCGEFAAMDLVQHSLAADSEGSCGLVEAQPAVRHPGPEVATESLVDAMRPGARGVSSSPVMKQPPVDGVFADAELTGGARTVTTTVSTSTLPVLIFPVLAAVR
jgi:hypothetical protein